MSDFAIDPAAAALIAAGATAAGPCPTDPAGAAAWERRVAERACALAALVPAVAERMARVTECKSVTGIIVSVRNVSGRAVITTRPTMGNRETEDFRTDWLNEPAGAAMAARARALVGHHVRLGKRIEKTRDGQKSVGMCEWIEDLGPAEASAPPAPAAVPPRSAAVAATPAPQDRPRLAAAPALCSDTYRKALLAMARRITDPAQRSALEAWLTANGVPPFISPELTAEQAARARAFLAHIDDVAGAA